jgi:PhzF family phenazine biosynthesis protein
MKRLSIYQVDSFTEKPFKGNPAGVCLLNEELPKDTLQSIATEMNLSETAFLLPLVGETGAYQIRYFTPTMEADLCGHATLASAKVLFSMVKLGINTLTFYTQSEILTVQKRASELVMNFPQYSLEETSNLPEEFWEVMQVSSLREIRYCAALKMLLIELGEGNELLATQPETHLLPKLDFPMKVEGVILTSHDTQALPKANAFDFMSRCFFPWMGIPEDPVTGAAHTILAPYWAAKLKKTELKAYQASERGGELGLKLLENNRLEISGEAYIFLKGELYMD